MADTTLTLNSTARFFDNGEYKNRLTLTNAPINPRDELGKIGLSIHNWFTHLFYKTVKVQVTILGKDNQPTTKSVYINKNSLIKYLKAYDPTYDATNKSNADLVTQLNSKSWQATNLNAADETLAAQQGAAGQTTLRHAGEHNRRPINNWRTAFADFFRGKFFSWLYQKTIGSLRRLRLRFAFGRKEKDYFEISEILAKRRFNQAAQDVPAYQTHLQQAAKLEKFSDIPITSKDAYIKLNKGHDWDLHNQGKYPVLGKVDTSTGTTGKPSVWMRSDSEVATVKKSLQVAAKIEFDARPLQYINAFALGQWATGLTTYELMRNTKRGGTFATGPNAAAIADHLELLYNYEEAQLKSAVASLIKKHKALSVHKQKIEEIATTLTYELLDNKDLNLEKRFSELTTLQPLFAQHKSAILEMVKDLNKEKSQIIIAGYPPFLKDLVDYIQQKGGDFKKYHVRAVVGGQAISEALRDKLVESGFTHVNSSYGASDLDINIGVETEFEMGLRKAIEKNPGLARELFGNNKGLPMVFHYDPYNYHIECDKDDELIFTCNRDNRSSPRIRYDLGDKGRVYAVSDIQALLEKYGIYDLKPRINLPLVFVWGRESALVYGGANVAFTEVERAITMVDKADVCLKRALYSYQDQDGKEQFEIWIELKDGVPLPNKEMSEKLLQSLLVNMAELNQDFRWQLEKLTDGLELPKLRLFTRHNSPISDADGHRKQVLIFKNGTGDLPADYTPEASEHNQVVSLHKDAEFSAALASPNAEQIDLTASMATSAPVVEVVVGHGPSSPRFMPQPRTVVTTEHPLRRESISLSA